MNTNMAVLQIFILSALFDLVVIIQGQTGNILEYSIYEEEDSKRVGDIKENSGIASRRTPEELSQLEFVFRYSTGFYQLFTINKRTGVVRTKGSIDREEICAYQDVCDIDLDIKVNPVTYFEIIKIKVKIEDKNDNRPVFTPSQKSTSVAETNNAGTLIPIPSADDKDSGLYGIQGYRLDKERPGSEKFDLQVTEHSDGSMDINIVLLERLDREKDAFYSLVVYAFDGDNPQQSGSITLDLTVTDVNDNTPTFANATYETTVYENMPLRSTILQVYASDPDSGDFGKVVYSLADSTQDVFGINEETGEIYVQGLIDYEQTQLYQFNVQAKDKGTNSLPTFAKVRIRVIDLNDHAPEITVNELTDSGNAEILENAKVGTFVAHIAVMDPDLGESGLFECEMDNAAFQLVPLSGSTMEYTLVSRLIFDRENIDEYHVLLTCADKGSPVLKAMEQIIVKVMDENDHSPTFKQKSFSAVLRENNSLNAFVMTIEADDEDSGRNAAIKYTLQGKNPSDDDLLVIDAISGVIKANTIFDYEKKRSYEFVVNASDHGDPPKSTRADLRLTVQDVNDEYPVFNEDIYLFTVQEDSPKDTSVGKVTATDDDSPQHGNITYRIDPSSRGNHRFYIDRLTGQIFTAEPLDWETQEIYHLGVIAENVGSPAIQTRVECRVDVKDINDNRPIIDFPNKNNNTLKISNQIPVDYMVTRIQAHDVDSKQEGNGKIEYMISEESNQHYFKVDQETGNISVAKNMEHIERQTVTVKVKVIDKGTPPKAAEADLIITIDKSEPSPLTQDGFFLEGNLMAILGSLVGLIFIIVVVTIAVCLLKYHRRRPADKGAKYNCRLEANKALNGGGMVKIPGSEGHSYEDDTASVKSDCSIDSPIKDVSKPLKKEVTFTFSHDEPYIQRSPAGRSLTQETTLSQDAPKFLSPAKKPARPLEFAPSGGVGGIPISERPARNYPHITDPRKYTHPMGLRHYDKSPTHPGLTPPHLHQPGMHDILNLSNHTDMDSECSGTDSGRGPSEEGDNLYANHHHSNHHHPNNHPHHPVSTATTAYSPLSSSSSPSQYAPPQHTTSQPHHQQPSYPAVQSQHNYRIDPYYSQPHAESRNADGTATCNPIYSTARDSSHRHSLRERPAGCSPTRTSPERASMRELPSHTLHSIPERPHRSQLTHNATPFSHKDPTGHSSPDRDTSNYRDLAKTSQQPQSLDARELIPLQRMKLSHSGAGSSPRKERTGGETNKHVKPFSTFKSNVQQPPPSGPNGGDNDNHSNKVPISHHQSHTDCVHDTPHFTTNTHSDHNGNYGRNPSQTIDGQHTNGYHPPHYPPHHQRAGSSQDSSFDHSLSLINNPADVSSTSDYSSRPSSTTSNREPLSIYQQLPEPPPASSMSSVSASNGRTMPNNNHGPVPLQKVLPSLLKTPPELRDTGNNKKEVRFAEDYGNTGSRPQEEGLSDSEVTCTSGSYVLDPAAIVSLGRVNNGAHYEDIPSFSVV